MRSLHDNGDLLEFLATHSLSSASLFEAETQELFGNRYAPDLLKYIVSCALDPCEGVEAAGFRWSGQLGLCDGQYGQWAATQGHEPEASWRDGPPTRECLERVSSCVLARANALNARVVISMRGRGLETMERVPVETYYRENRGIPIRSFQSCGELCLWGDPLKRNCDFSPRYVGQCIGGQVTLRLDNDRQRARIRVCAGIYGCDDPSPRSGGTTDEHERSYGGVIIGRGRNRVTFPCPENGPLVADRRSGYYSVMLAPAEHDGELPMDVDVVASYQNAAAEGAYPAEEAAVFSYREGAFFGNIFTRLVEESNPTCPGQSRLTSEQHACFSEIWNQGDAYLAHRICAGPTDDFADGCFASTPGPCAGSQDGRCQRVARPQRLFQAKPGDEHGFYEQCRSSPAADPTAPGWPNAYTIYLNHPCDLTDDYATCLGLLQQPVAQALPSPYIPGMEDSQVDSQARPSKSSGSSLIDLFD